MKNLQTPKDWRKGQTLYNFLVWLKEEKGFHKELVDNGNSYLEESNSRMADPFHIGDKKLEELYQEFLEFYNQ